MAKSDKPRRDGKRYAKARDIRRASERDAKRRRVNGG